MTKQPKMPEAVLEFFKKTGSIGGRNRAANMTAEQRSEQARKAVRARWAKQADKNKGKKESK